MPCGVGEMVGAYCSDCQCTKKECYRCGSEKTLSEFEVSTKPYILKMESQKGRVFSCNQCVDKLTKE